MGVKRRNGSKMLKRNKASKSAQKRWSIASNSQTLYTPRLFEDNPAEFNSPDDTLNPSSSNFGEEMREDMLLTEAHDVVASNGQEIPSPLLCSNTNLIHDNVVDVDDLINSHQNWCTNKYFPRYFQQPGITTEKHYNEVQKHTMCIEHTKCQENPLIGYRIVDLSYVLSCTLQLQFEHSQRCSGKFVVKHEERRGTGLVSTVTICCDVCSEKAKFSTENPNQPSPLLNIGAVWGTLATGSTFGHMNEFLSFINVPPMQQKMFYNIEDRIGEECKKSLFKAMTKSGEIERQHAIDIEEFNEGVPAITVYVDGSWSKRSYGTNFNSLSGMVGIVGKFTNELLFVAVRNKFCSICTHAETKNIPTRAHTCFKNWSGSAPAMEADMVAEGFNLSEAMHGVRYTKFVADGDSSVFAKLRSNVPYGPQIKKIECTNHAIKNYTKHLRNIKSDTKINLQGRKILTDLKISKLKKRARCSIYEHSKCEEQNVSLLRRDLELGLNHVFGDHMQCREGICNTPGDQTTNMIPTLKETNTYYHLSGALDLLVRKAHLLISNENNNRCERLMNIVARFNMGKRLNLVQRGSYERRVYASCLSYTKGASWQVSPWKRMTGGSPGKYLKEHVRRNSVKRIKVRKNLFGPSTSCAKAQTKRNLDYGPEAEYPDEDEDIISMESQRILDKLQVNQMERDRLAYQTIGQFNNDLYLIERQKRLTASMFGRVIKKRPDTLCHNLVKQCLHQNSFYSESTNYGITKEVVAIKRFEHKKDINVSRSGLWIDIEHGFLAASPDGLVGDNTIVEVKCLYAASKLGLKTIEEIIEKMKGKICLEKKENIVQLKRSHGYYYQIQGQLHITGKEKCYFIVYINDEIELFIEEIMKDDVFWETKMLPKLIFFYKNCVLPEIILNRIGRGLKCKEPLEILEERRKHKHQTLSNKKTTQ